MRIKYIIFIINITVYILWLFTIVSSEFGLLVNLSLVIYLQKNKISLLRVFGVGEAALLSLIAGPLITFSTVYLSYLIFWQNHTSSPIINQGIKIIHDLIPIGEKFIEIPKFKGINTKGIIMYYPERRFDNTPLERNIINIILPGKNKPEMNLPWWRDQYWTSRYGHKYYTRSKTRAELGKKHIKLTQLSDSRYGHIALINWEEIFLTMYKESNTPQPFKIRNQYELALLTADPLININKKFIMTYNDLSPWFREYYSKLQANSILGWYDPFYGPDYHYKNANIAFGLQRLLQHNNELGYLAGLQSKDSCCGKIGCTN